MDDERLKTIYNTLEQFQILEHKYRKSMLTLFEVVRKKKTQNKIKTLSKSVFIITRNFMKINFDQKEKSLNALTSKILYVNLEALSKENIILVITKFEKDAG